MIRTLTSALAAVALAAAASSAEESIVIETVGVDFSDPAQAAMIYDKVVAAAETVCEDLYLRGSSRLVSYYERRRLYASCIELTLEDTLATAGVSALSAIHASAPVTSSFAVASN